MINVSHAILHKISGYAWYAVGWDAADIKMLMLINISWLTDIF